MGGGGGKEAALTGAQVIFEPEEKGDSGGLMGWLGLGELVKVSGGKWDWGGRREGREKSGEGGTGCLVS